MTGLTWRPVREDDQLDPGDRVRLARDTPGVVGYQNELVTWHAFSEFEVVTALHSCVMIRRKGCWRAEEWLNMQRMDLEVPR